MSAGDRQGLERLLRYIDDQISYPPHPGPRSDILPSSLQWTDDGRVRLRFTRPWKNGVDAMTLTPHNLIARLVPLVPRPGTHQLRYYGALAARSELRPLIIPQRPSGVAQLPMFNRRGEPTPRARQKTSQEQQPEREISSPPHDSSSENETPPTEPPSAPANPPPRSPPLQKLRPMSWAEAMERMAGHNVEACPWCGARLAPIIVVLDQISCHLQMRFDGRSLSAAFSTRSRPSSRRQPAAYRLGSSSFRSRAAFASERRSLPEVHPRLPPETRAPRKSVPPSHPARSPRSRRGRAGLPASLDRALATPEQPQFTTWSATRG